MNLTGGWLIVYYTLVYFAWGASLLFPISYGLTRPWYKTEPGRHLFSFSTVVAIAMTLIAIRPVFGDFPGRVVISFVVLLALGIVCSWRFALFLRASRRDRRSDDDPRS